MAIKTWPAIANRNVAQPSRVRLSTAPEAGPDVYDVTPVPGTVANAGTLLNKALFDSEKAYIDQNDTPVVYASSTDGLNYTATVPAWVGVTAAELKGHQLVIIPNKTNVAGKVTLKINNAYSVNIYFSSPSRLGADVTSTFPAGYIRQGGPIVLVFLSNAIAYTLSIAEAAGGTFSASPWAIGVGGTGANTAAGARSNLAVPSIRPLAASPGLTREILNTDGSVIPWLAVGDLTTSSTGITPPINKTAEGLGFIGTEAWPFQKLYAKSLNGTLAATSLSGIVPIGNGGTGTNSVNAAVNAMFVVKSIGGNGYTQIPANADLDNYGTVGNYCVSGNQVANTIKNTPCSMENLPSPIAFILTVDGSLGGNLDIRYLRQTYQSYKVNNGTPDYRPAMTFSRIKNETTNAWGPWTQVTASGYATSIFAGLVKVDGTTITIDSNGVISSTGGRGGGGGSYILPKASASTLGGIKVGGTLSIDGNGILNVGVVDIAHGGTGAANSEQSRVNLNVPSLYVSSTLNNGFKLCDARSNELPYQNVGLTNSISGGVVPAIMKTTGWGYIGTETWPFFQIHGKSLFGSLAATSLTGVVPIGSGGTGVNSRGNIANALGLSNLTYGLPNLPNGTDLNTLKTPGNYCCNDNMSSRTFLNTPHGANIHLKNQAFNLKVEASLWSMYSTKYLRQIYREYDSSIVYERIMLDGTTWGDWYVARPHFVNAASPWSNLDYASTSTLSTQALAYWTGAYDSAGNSNIAYVHTILKGWWRGTPIELAYGGTGANTVPGARANLGLSYTNTVSTAGASSQVVSCYHIGPHMHVLDIAALVPAKTGNNSQVTLATLTIPSAITIDNFTPQTAVSSVISYPIVKLTNNSSVPFQLVVTSNKTIDIAGWLQNGTAISAQTVKASVILYTAQI